MRSVFQVAFSNLTLFVRIADELDFTWKLNEKFFVGVLKNQFFVVGCS